MLTQLQLALSLAALQRPLALTRAVQPESAGNPTSSKDGSSETPPVTRTRPPASVVGSMLKSTETFVAEAITPSNTNIWTQRSGVQVCIVF
jgi:hypothetical protein